MHRHDAFDREFEVLDILNKVGGQGHVLRRQRRIGRWGRERIGLDQQFLLGQVHHQQVVGMACAVALSFALIMILHALAVGRSVSFRSLWPGAALAALALLLIQLLWERTSTLSPSLNQTYGGIAGLVTSMLGVWLAAFAILLGAFVNRWLIDRRGRIPA